MAPIKIETPRGKVFLLPNSQAKLEFITNFVDKWQDRYSRSQMFVDSEVLRLCEPYTPLLSSMLIKSAILGTTIGSGLVQWITPYARRQYYSKRPVGSQTGPLRGPYWFERMKSVWKTQIIQGARTIAATGNRK